MSNPHQELASPDQTVFGKDSSNPLMADNFPKIVWYSTHHVILIKSWLVQKQTALGKDKANSLIVNSLLKTIWSSIHHLLINEVFTIPGQTATGVNTPRCDEDRLELIKLTVFLLSMVEKVGVKVSAVDLQVFAVRLMLQLLVHKFLLFGLTNSYCSFWTTVAVKKVNDIIRLQALVDKKKVMVTEATIREVLLFDDAEGVECLPNEEIFAELARMGYEKPSTKLTFYKAFFSSHQWHLLSYAYLQEVEEGDADKNVVDVNVVDAAKGDVSATHGEVPTADEEPFIPSLTLLTPPPQPSQDIPSTSQGRMIVEMNQDADVILEDDKEVANDVKDVQDDIDESAQDQGRKAESQAEIYKIDLEHANKVLSMQEDESEPAEVQEVVDVVTTAKIITEVGTAAIIRDPQEESTTSIIIPSKTKSKDKGKGILVEEPKPLKKQAQIKQDEKYARELEAELNKNIDWDKVIDHVKKKAKEDPAVKKYQALKRKPQTKAQARKNMMLYLKNVAGFKMDYFNGMSYDDIRPIFEAKFNTNVAFLLKTKEQIKEDESRALKRLNETPTEKAAKRQKLDEEVEELKRHLQIVPNEDDDVYTEATPLGRKDLETLWSLVKERFSTTKPKNFFDDFLLITLGAMFEKPDIHAQIYKNQRSVHGPAKVKGWKLLESCGMQIITFTTTQLILLVEMKYLLTSFTLDHMLNAVRLKVEEESEVSLELLRFI
nr:hypothetical protein [Tanacetum cinerariifolium]